MIELEAESFVHAHLEITKRVLRSNGHDSLSLIIEASDRLPFNLVGYSSDRWIKYTDAYLYGGKSFNDFLAKPCGNSVSTFVFGGRRAHSRGPCILTLSVSKDLIHLNARILHWMNAAVLDLNLAWLLIRHYKRPLWITCPRVVIQDWQLAGYRLLGELKVKNRLVDNARDFRRDPNMLAFDRHQHKAKRTFSHENKDEEEVVTNFPRVIPEDIARVVGMKGVKLRNLLRAKFGHATRGEVRASHSWASYDDPRFIALASLLKIDKKKLPTVLELVERRVSGAV